MINVYQESKNIFNILLETDHVNLLPSSCELSIELNGSWELNLTHPLLGDGRWKYIKPGAIITAPSYNGIQMFRIVKTELSENEITALCYPIFMDAANWVFIPNLEIAETTGADAIYQLNKYIKNTLFLKNAYFELKSNLTSTASLSLKNVNLITAINGDDEDSQSIVNTFGGQIEFNNVTCVINEKIGNQTPVEYKFGKNITGLRKTLSREETFTRIYPISKDGYSITANQPWLDIANAPFENPYARSVVFENLEVADYIDKNVALRLYAAAFIAAESQSNENFAKEAEYYEIDLALLNNTNEYKAAGYSQKVGLGDMVHISAPEYDIDFTAQITKMTYDCIRDIATSVTVGQPVKDYFQTNSLRTIPKDLQSWMIKEG